MHTSTNNQDWQHLSLEEQLALDTLRANAVGAVADYTTEFNQQYPDVEVQWTVVIDAYPRKTVEAEKALLG